MASNATQNVADCGESLCPFLCQTYTRPHSVREPASLPAAWTYRPIYVTDDVIHSPTHSHELTPIAR